MRTIIAGSRTINSYPFVRDAIEKTIELIWRDLPSFEVTEVVSGHARGVDQLGEQWASFHSLPKKIMPAEWETYGDYAGPKRNIQMAEYAHQSDESPGCLIAIWDGKSNGTKNMISNASQRGLITAIYDINEVVIHFGKIGDYLIRKHSLTNNSGG